MGLAVTVSLLMSWRLRYRVLDQALDSPIIAQWPPRGADLLH